MIRFVKCIIKLLPVTFLTFFIISCDKDETITPDPNIAFTATLNGAVEVPANSSAASGSSTATYNRDTKILTISTTYSGMTAVAAHIHKGAVGVSGAVIFPFTDLPSPINFITAPLDAAQEADLMANLYYVNLHSTAYPGGEIRGQLLKQ